MIGAITGDVIGSVHEGAGTMTKNFELFVPLSTFTDDTVLTVAIASAIRQKLDYGGALREWGRRYPFVPYGGSFHRWLRSADPRPYGSYGNGSAMRVSPVGWAFDDLESVLREAQRTAEVTHNHPEGIKGAQAVAFLESQDFEDAIRIAVSLGADADTLACIAGAIAEPFYGGVPAELQREAMSRLDEPLREEALAFAREHQLPGRD